MRKLIILLIGVLIISNSISAFDFPSDGVEIVSVSSTTITGNLTEFIDLTDTPNSYTGDIKTFLH